MTKNWVKIYISTNPIETEMIKQMLNSNNIISVIISHQDSSYNMFGTIDLQQLKVPCRFMSIIFFHSS